MVTNLGLEAPEVITAGQVLTHLMARSTLRARMALKILNSLRISKATSCPAATLLIINGSKKSRRLISTITKSEIYQIIKQLI